MCVGQVSTFAPAHGLRFTQLLQPVVARPTVAVDRRESVISPKMMWGFLPPQKESKDPEINIVELTSQEEFESMLFTSRMTDQLLVVDWYASWCKVCVFLEPRFRKMAKEYADKVIFVKLDAIVLEYNDGVTLSSLPVCNQKLHDINLIYIQASLGQVL